MDIERGHAVFASLRRVDFDREGRDPHHNLTDPREITAVAIGLKPAFLGGQSLSDWRILNDLGEVAGRLGIHVQRSGGIIPVAEFLALHPPPLDRGYLENLLEQALKKEPEDDPVLWIYSDANAEKLKVNASSPSEVDNGVPDQGMPAPLLRECRRLPSLSSRFQENRSSSLPLAGLCRPGAPRTRR